MNRSLTALVTALLLLVPAVPALARETAGTLRVNDHDLAGSLPGGVVARGSTDVPLLRLDLSAQTGPVKVTGIRVDRTGSAVDSDVPMVRILRDADGDRTLGPGDVKLGESGFVGGIATVGSLDLAVTPGSAVTIFVLVDVSATAQIGKDFRAAFADRTYFLVESPSDVDPDPFGFESSRLGIQATAPVVLRAARIDLAAAVPSLQVTRGDEAVTMLRLDLTAFNGPVTVGGIRVDKRGTSARDADVPRARLWKDGGDGVFQTADAALASGVFVGATVTLGGLSILVTGSGTVMLFITFDIAADATPGTTVGADVREASYVSVAAPAVVDPDPFGLRSTDLTVSSAPPKPGSDPGSAGTGAIPGEMLLIGIAALVVIVLLAALLLGRRKKRGVAPAPPAEPKQ